MLRDLAMKLALVFCKFGKHNWHDEGLSYTHCLVCGVNRQATAKGKVK